MPPVEAEDEDRPTVPMYGNQDVEARTVTPLLASGGATSGRLEATPGGRPEAAPRVERPRAREPERAETKAASARKSGGGGGMFAAAAIVGVVIAGLVVAILGWWMFGGKPEVKVATIPPSPPVVTTPREPPPVPPVVAPPAEVETPAAEVLPVEAVPAETPTTTPPPVTPPPTTPPPTVAPAVVETPTAVPVAPPPVVPRETTPPPSTPPVSDNPWGSPTTSATGRLRISPDPNDATVLVDGVQKGKGTVTVELAYGDHEIRVVRNGYLAETKTVSVQARELSVPFSLRPDFRSGQANISCALPGCKVTVDGNEVGATAMITEGLHTFRMVGDGGINCEKTRRVDFPDDKPVTVAVSCP